MGVIPEVLNLTLIFTFGYADSYDVQSEQLL